MGLDVYVGPLTRYYAGTWKTVMEQVAESQGIPFHTLRTSAEPADRVTDATVIAEAVAIWQATLGAGLEADLRWADDGDLPYWTDKPDWDGYGALVLLAAYQVRPDLAPGTGRGNAGPADDPRDYAASPAVQAAMTGSGGAYPSLLLGVEWWLPIDRAPAVFMAETVGGEQKLMSRVDLLLDELSRLNDATLCLDEAASAAALERGAVTRGSALEAVAAFGLASFTRLAGLAKAHRQPLLLDY